MVNTILTIRWKYFLHCASLCLALHAACASADEPTPLKMDGIKARYSVGEPVRVKVTNLSSREVVFGIGVLMQVDGKWEECLTNVNDIEMNAMAFRMVRVHANSIRVFTFDPARVIHPRLEKGAYRIYLAYEDKEGKFAPQDHLSGNIGSMVGHPTRQLLFSEVFELNP